MNNTVTPTSVNKVVVGIFSKTKGFTAVLVIAALLGFVTKTMAKPATSYSKFTTVTNAKPAGVKGGKGVKSFDIYVSAFKNSTGGADGFISVGVTVGQISDYQFRINGGDYQSSNTFSGLMPGQYLIEAIDKNFETKSIEQNIITSVENCSNGIDDDGDGLIDCQDTDCPACASTFNCDNPNIYYVPAIYGLGDGALVGSATYSPQQVVLSTNFPTAQVTVRTRDNSFNQTYNITNTSPTEINVPMSFVQTNNINTVQNNKGFIVTSNNPINVAYKQNADNNQDISVSKGTAATGYSFFAGSQTKISSNVSNNDERHFVGIMATENNTTVTFRCPVALQGFAAGTTNTVTLQEGQTYVIATPAASNQANVSISGTRVTSNRPIVVISGSQHSAQPFNGNRDAGFDQLVPAHYTGTQYLTVSSPNTNANSSYITAVATENNTQVKVNGTVVGTINAGQWIDAVIPPNNQPSLIELSKKGYVYNTTARASYEFGMAILPPVNQCLGGKRQVVFRTPTVSAQDGGFVIIRTSDLPSLTINGVAFNTISGVTQGTTPLAGWSYMTFPNSALANVGLPNVFAANGRFSMGVTSNTGPNQTGSFGFYSNYDAQIDVLDPVSNLATNSYFVQSVAPGATVSHCLNMNSCGNTNFITSILNGTQTQSTSITSANCFNYTMKPTAGACVSDTIRIEVQNELGIRDVVCLVFRSNANITGTITASNGSNPVRFCAGGSVNLTATGTSSNGIASYVWTRPNNTTFVGQTLTNVNAAGTYSVRITDNNGCFATFTVNVSQNPALTLSGSNQVNVACFGQSTGAVTLVAGGGTSPYQFRNGSGALQSSATFSGLAAGNYTFWVVDAAQCSTSVAINITQASSAVVANASGIIQPSCTVGTGSVTITATGGVGPYTYRRGTSGAFSSTNTFTGIAPGTYTFQAQDANGCIDDVSVTINAAPPTPVLTVSSQTNVLCFGQATGSVTLSATGGNGITYRQGTSGTFGTNNVFTGLAAGSYTFQANNDKGCIGSINVIITGPADAVTASSSNLVQPTCTVGTGSITINGAGGVGPYTFRQGTSGSFTSNNVFSGLAPGSYTFQAQDANGCIASTNVTINAAPSTPTVTVSSQTNVLCFGQSTGSVTLSATGGSGFTFRQGTSGTFGSNNVFSGLAAGSYTFQAQNSTGCIGSVNVTITQPATAVSGSIGSQTNVLCFGNSTGAVTINGAGGVGPYQYRQGTGGTFANPSTFSGLAAGNYVFQVRDANGCIASVNVAITQPSAALAGGIANQVNVLCFGQSTGSVTLNANGGTSPYQYRQGTSGAFANPATFTGLAAGSYTFQVQDANGCIDDVQVVITQPSSAVSVTASNTIQPTCTVGTGSVTLNGTGGTGTINYRQGTSGAFASNNVFAGLAPGSYTFQAQDANGCIASTSVTINAAPSTPTVTVSSQTNVLCFGQSTGSVTLSASGGSGFTFRQGTSGTFGSNNVFSGLAAGSYTFQAQNSTGCIGSVNVTITQPATAVSGSIGSQTNVLCFGNSTGAVTINGAGGVGPYQYRQGTGGTFANPNTFSGLAAGNYVFQVRDANGCIASVNVTITQPSAALAGGIANQVNVLCFGQSTGSVTLNANGGTSPYQYRQGTSGTFANPATFNGLAAGSYTFQVQDANGCIDDVQVVITQPSSAVSLSSSNIINAACGASNGSLTAVGSGGVGSYQYSLNSGSFQASGIFNGLAGGSYSITVRDGNNCTATINVTVPNNAGPSATIGSQTNVLCFGQSTGAVTISVNGGTAPYTYQLGSGTPQSSAIFNGLAAGAYVITVRDVNNCSSTVNVTITQPATAVVASLGSQTNVLCFGQATGAATITANGGVGPYTYRQGTSGSFGSNNVFSGLAAGTYTFQVRDANLCIDDVQVTITQPATAVSGSIGSQTNVLCFGNSTGAVTINGAGGVGPYQYRQGTGGTFANPNTFSGLAAGNYVFQVRDANGCIASVNVTITQPSAALAGGIANQVNVLCFGQSTGSVILNANGGTSPYQYRQGTSGTFANPATFNGLAAGSYTFQVQDANGCIDDVQVVITQPSSAVSLSSSNIINAACGASNGSLTAVGSGGVGSYQYSLNGGSFQASGIFNGLAGGSYSITVRDGNNCTATINVTVPNNAGPSATIGSQTNVLCFGQSTGAVTISVNGGTSPYTYQLGSGTPQSSATFNGLAAGAYVITVRDVNNCSSVVNVTITQPASAVTASATSLVQPTCTVQSGSVTITANGGVAPYQYRQGTSGAFSAINSYSGLAVGSYTFQVRDANNCIASVNVTINAVPNCAPVANPDNASTPEDTPVTINVPSNDTDPNNNINLGSVTIADQPNNGTVSINPTTGAITYTPNANFNGVDFFVYQICDTGSPIFCDTAVVIITVSPVNDAPIANPDNATTPEDTPVTINVPSNDTDVDGNLNIGSVTIVDQPNNGTVSVNPTTGVVTYTPNANFNGVDQFIYRICDTGSPILCDTALVTINVTGVNDPPIANNDNASTPEDTPVTIPVLGNDTDPDGTLNPSTVTIITPPNPTTGTVTVNPNGTITFNPAPNYNGPATFVYQVCDNGMPVLCDQATVNINVTPVNDAPIANPDNATTPEDTPVTINVPSNDTDVDGNLNVGSVTITDQPNNGTVSVNPTTGVVTYTPNANFNGVDQFIYRICDTGSPILCDTALVTINVTGVNDPPIANNDNASTPEDTPVTIPVIGNDTDPDGVIVPTTVTIITPPNPSTGTVTVNPNGTITFTPAPNYNGPATFVYQVCDNGMPVLCDQATVNINVTPVNDAPIANPDNATTPEDTPVTINVPSNDTDVDGNLNIGSVTIVDQPNNGTVSVNPTTGVVTYTPNANFNGVDQFIYRICDTGSPILCDTALVTINVNGVNDPPIANNDNASTPEDTPVTIPVLGNDTDPDGTLNPSTVTIITPPNPTTGTVTVNPNGTITFTPAPNYNGPATFVYQVCDNGMPVLCDQATVNINVTPVNDAPVANPDNATTPEDTPVTINVPSNDTDVDGNLNIGSVTIVDQPNNGTVSVNPTTGVVTYTPNANFNGVDQFIYRICDTGSPILCDTALVTINVNPTNDPPVANPDNVSTPEDTPINIPVLTNDTDPDNNINPGSVTIITPPNPATGTVTVNPVTGVVTFTPAPNYNGPTSFVYQVCDTGMPVLCDTAVVNINVIPVNDPPVANPDNANTPEDTPVTINVPSNDTDVDGNLNVGSVTITQAPANGTVSVNPITGAVTYTPNLNYTGPDAFIYRICDTGMPILCDTALVRINVAPVNDPPVANDDFVSTPEDTPILINVPVNDTDPDNGLNLGSVTIISPPANGTVIVNPTTGQVLYTPNPNYNGPDGFVYQICDNGSPALCDQAFVAINVLPVNDPPVANPDNAITNEDTPVTIVVLGNDTDPDGNIAVGSVTITSFPQFGSLSVNPITGAITYTPNLNYNGPDAFIYRICDTGVPILCDTALVRITVLPVNDPPVADDDAVTTPEDTPVIIPILGNDTDPDGVIVPSTVTIITPPNPSTGSVTVNPNGTVTFTPAPNYNGPASFVYQVCDNGSPVLCDQATVTINVLPVNDPPIANPDNATTNEDTPVAITVPSNDSDVDGNLNINSVGITQQPSNGVVSVGPGGIITYTPNPNFNGVDQFIYRICDTGVPALCDTALVTVNVVSINDPLVANPDNATTPEDVPVTIPVLNNDVDPDNNINPASVTITVQPTNGTLAINPVTGAITYTPNLNFNGNDAFIYQVCDLGTPVFCDTALVRITIIPVNDPPVANPDNATTNEDTPVVINVPSNDTDPENNINLGSVTITDQPDNGTVTVNPTTGAITYTPNTNFNGVDQFIYRICDTGVPALCDTALVTINVTPVNDAPIANPDNATTNEDTPVVINVPANDTDVDGNLNVGSVTITDQPNNGTVSVNPVTGQITYTPNTNFNGVDQFIYQICDTGMPVLCDTALVTINVTPVNDAPIANPDNATTNEDTPVTINAPSNDTDVDGNLNPASVTITDQPNNGTVSVNPVTGQVTYTPNANFNGVDQFIYQICDTGMPVLCDTALVTINVAPINDAPIANPDNATTNEDTPVVINVPSNDTDVDGNLNPASVTITDQPNNGTVSVNPVTGQITYTPNTNFNGVDQFIYQICDTGMPVLCDTALVTINVTPVNDAPIANPDNATTNEDTPVTINVPSNDTDVDGNLDVTNVTITDQPNNGTVSVNPVSGQITYTPNTNFNGVDQFIYQICDTGMPVLCDTALVTINVTPVNDAPIANPDNATTPEDTPVVINVPANDTDVDGNLNVGSVTITDQPNNGTVSVNPVTGQVTYTPNTNFNGVDQFIYQICDTGMPVLCDTAVVNIVITPVNDALIAVPDADTTGEDTPVSIQVLLNDIDIENDIDTASMTIFTQPLNGSVAINFVTGEILYTPNLNFNGLDSFVYRVCDGGLPVLCDTAVVKVFVVGINDAPVANPDNATTPEDTPVVINVPANDTDVDGNLDVATVTITDQPNNGTVTVDPVTGQVTYTPNANFNGVDQFIYQICDGGAPVLCDTALVTITVTPVNDPPIAVNDQGTTPEDTPALFPISNNDSDPDGAINPASATIIGGPSNGTAGVVVNPITGIANVFYSPDLNFNGLDTITYVICDNGVPAPVLCDTAILVITVTPVNDPPVAVNDTVTTPEDTPIAINVPANDSDVDGNLNPNSVAILVGNQPLNGTAVVGPNGVIIYTPNANFTGLDSLQYTICDTGMPILCTTAWVYITVTPVNDAPIANPDNASTPEDTPVVINVPANDTDVDGNLNVGSVTITDQPNNGSVSVDPLTGEVTYTPNTNFNGVDQFIYQICDTGNPVLCDTALVTIVVSPVNDSLIANPDADTTLEDTPVVVDVLANDTDVDGNIDPTNVTITDQPNNGSVSVDPVTGEITYTPNPNFNGVDQFVYQVCDTGLPVYCDTALVTIVVVPVNDAPVANPDNASTPEDTPVVINVPSNDTDVDGNLNVGSVTITDQPNNGSVSVNPVTGQVTYTPNTNFNGVDQFIYQICDTGNPVLCDTALVTIVVSPVNDSLIANPDADTTLEDTPVVVDVLANDTDVDGNIDPTSVTITDQPNNGSVSVDPVTGEITYTPNPNFNGVDQFVYQVCDTGLPVYCDTALVTIVVVPVNDCPVAIGEMFTTVEDSTITVNVTGNDIDVDGNLDSVSVTIVSGPFVNGSSATVNANGTITYVPAPNYNGADTLIYSVCDNFNPVCCDTAMVIIKILPVNDPPVANPDTASTLEDTPVTVDVTANDTDIDGNLDLGSVTITQQPANGTVVIDTISGAITYTPNTNFNGVDQFIYQICDTGNPVFCDTALVTITVTPVNDPPVAVNDTTTTPEETPVVIDVLDNDTDPENNIDTTSVTILTPPANGSAVVLPNGTIIYTPDSNFVGVDTFTYRICDTGIPVFCDSATVFIIVTPTPDIVLDPSIYNNFNISCFGANDGFINLTVDSGAAPYSYAWTGPNGFTASTEDISGLAPGQYCVTVTDTLGNTEQGCVTLVEPTQVTAQAQVSIFNGGVNISCANAADGSVTIVPSGGNAPYTVIWNDNVVGATRDSLAAGQYIYNVVDANGCQFTDTVNIIAPTVVDATNAVSLTDTGFNITCNGAADAFINVTVTGGVAPYTIAWTGGLSGFNPTGVAAGQYIYTVTDANGCTDVDTVNITQPPVIVVTPAVVTYNGGFNVSCNGAADGSIALTITGGNGGESVVWSFNGAFFGTGATINNLAAGQYIFTVSDALGCSSTDTINVTEPTPVVADASAFVYPGGNNISCNGASNGQGFAGATGGSAPYAYEWFFNGASIGANDTISNLAPGQYILVATDANGCTDADTINIVEPAVVNINGSLSVYTGSNGNFGVSCNGASDGSIDLTITGGSAPYNYSWTGVGGFFANTQDISGLVSGSYTVIVTDTNGCADTATFDISQPLPINAQAAIVNEACGTSNGSINLTVTGGLGGNTYSWTGPGAFTATTEDITGLAAGQYCVTITSGNGCSIDTCYNVGAQPPVTVEPTQIVDATCPGTNTGAIDITILTGQAPFNVSWTGPNGFTSTNTDIVAVVNGAYTVTITDANNCSVTATYSVGAPAPLVAQMVNMVPATCTASNGNLDITPVGGSATYSYAWVGPNNASSTSQDLVGVAGGQWCLTLTDLVSGCSIDTCYNIAISSPISGTTEVVNVTCNGANNGSITVNLTGATGPVVYTWLGAGLQDSTSNTADNLAPGQVIVFATDANGCTYGDTITITEPAPITVTEALSEYPNGYNITTTGGTDGNIDLTVTGGTTFTNPQPPYQVEWTSTNPGAPLGGIEDQVNQPAGIYFYTITDANGCQYTDSVELEEPPLLIMPTGFSPANNDGMNDLYVIKGLEMFPDNEFTVFNRWGQVVFNQKSYNNDWGGTNFKGQILPDGTYYCILRVNMGPLNGGEKTFRATVELRRELGKQE